MNKKQAEQYFQWYQTQKDNRINQLQEYIKTTSSKKILLDKNPDSLINLWEWFEDKIEIIPLSQEEIRITLNGKTAREKSMLKEHTTKMSLLTMALAEDISIYFAETFVLHNSRIYWGYKTRPKMLDGVNEPILLGFDKNVSVNQRTLISVCIRRTIRKQNCEELYETYKIWEKHAL